MVAVNCFCRNVSTPTIFIVAHPRIRAWEYITAPFANIHGYPINEKLIYIYMYVIYFAVYNMYLTNHYDAYGRSIAAPSRRTFDCTISV